MQTVCLKFSLRHITHFGIPVCFSARVLLTRATRFFPTVQQSVSLVDPTACVPCVNVCSVALSASRAIWSGIFRCAFSNPVTHSRGLFLCPTGEPAGQPRLQLLHRSVLGGLHGPGGPRVQGARYATPCFSQCLCVVSVRCIGRFSNGFVWLYARVSWATATMYEVQINKQAVTN
jgi:hypothetical protein